MARQEEEHRQEERRSNENAARKSARGAVDREKVRAALKAASGKEVEDEAVQSASALLEDKLARIAARAAEHRVERNEDNINAAHVAVAAQREQENRE
jgi:hypothetical protein